MPRLPAMASPLASWSVASISTSTRMFSTGGPASRSASVRSLPPSPDIWGVSVRVIVSGLYWNTTRLATGLNGSTATMAPRCVRGVRGNELMASLPPSQAGVHGPRHLRAQRLGCGVLRHAHGARVQTSHLAAGEALGQSLRGEQPRELLAHRLAHLLAVSRGDAVEHQLVDVQGDASWRHVHPETSASAKGLSSLLNSERTARWRWAIRTGSLASAARKAALRAMVRMFPPVTLSRASRATSRPWVGVAAGNMRRQISARWVASGKGNCNTKRSRRRKAVSSASFMFVVRMARPLYASICWSR